MNYNDLVNHLNTKNYSASLDQYNEIPCVCVKVQIQRQDIELIHFIVKEFSCLPVFYLKNSKSFGQLAHVLNIFDLGSICVNDRDSVSVNYEQPQFAIEESLKRHIAILKKAITDPKWNKQELLREFYSNWLTTCDSSDHELICASATGGLEEMQVLRPVSGKNYGFDSHFLGITSSATELAEFSYVTREQDNGQRTIAGKGFVLPLDYLAPAPSHRDELRYWYINAINHLSESDNHVFRERFAKQRSKEFWLVFNAGTPSGRTWFGLHFQNKNKKTLPISDSSLEQWKVKPIKIRVFNKERLMPRSGASMSLSDKKVLLVGCGSVGGEIANKLGAAGIGTLKLSDPDEFTLDNLYRHVLSGNFYGCPKGYALEIVLEFKYPWIDAKGDTESLLDIRSKQKTEQFDLIIIAIGSPTHERIFHDFLIENKIKTPVINTWVEGYGVGGHATLDIPSSKGCLRCAYVDQNNLGRGLSSNLNFFDVDQDLTVNHAGCGDLYLPYTAISAAQTALIASDLAVKYLEGKITESSKVSWKGDEADAIKQGFSLTHRYKMFNSSLQILSLYNEYCDICNG